MKLTLGKCMLLCLLSTVTFNAYAEWTCYAGDKKGHYWMSTGWLEERAARIAINFCTAYSPHPGSCHKSKCFEKKL